MKLSSKPKPVNFRIVLNNVEITSIELLQQHFDFERHLVTDQAQFISWLKRKYKDRGDRVEDFFNHPADEISYVADIISILNIIYEPKQAFNNLVDFVKFLYDNNDNKRYEVAKSNFKNYISKNGKLLHKWFPIDSIPKNNKNLYKFFDSLDVSLEKADYQSRLYYWHGNIEKSRQNYPPLWKLDTEERTAIQAIASGSQLKTVNDVIASANLSIIGAEFIFLCAIALLSFHPNDAQCKFISELIDDNPSFKLLRDRIDGSMKKIIKKKNPNFFKVFEDLGYTEPHKLDPLFNEKLFLSSFFAEDVKRDVILKEITEKTDYFPAHYLLGEDGYDSKVLKSRDESFYLRWLSHILDYYDNPTGLDGDSKAIREMAIIVHQFKEEYKLMCDYFHFPSDLSANFGNINQREHISHIKSALGKAGLKNVEKYGTVVGRNIGLQRVFGSWAKNPPALSKTEREYLDFFKEVVDICNHWGQYIIFSSGNNKGRFTKKAELLIKKYKEKTKNKTLWNEKLFVVAILLLVRDHNRNSINEEENEIKQLKKMYIPLRALFYDEIDQLNKNDKKILKSTLRDERLRNNWLVYNCPEMRDNNVYRKNFYGRILSRWVANFIYYTE